MQTMMRLKADLRSKRQASADASMDFHSIAEERLITMDLAYRAWTALEAAEREANSPGISQ